MKKDSSLLKLKISAALIVGVLVTNGISSFNDHTKTITITRMERVSDGDDSKYMVWGEDANGTLHVFENTDNWLRLKFNSSDIYGDLHEGGTYEFQLNGFRIPISSSYENILSYKLVDQGLFLEDGNTQSYPEKSYEEMTDEEKIAFLEQERERLLQLENSNGEYDLDKNTYSKRP